MRVIIMGGGKVGSYLAREVNRAGHAVILVEKNPEKAAAVAESVDALVFAGDGSDLHLLHEIELRSTDFVAAVTGVDEDNLVACQLARAAFGVSKVLARLNDPRNQRTFDALGIPSVSVTHLLSQVIARELDLSELVRVALLGRGDVSLLEVEIPAGLPPRLVGDVFLPPSSVLVAIRRAGGVIVPSGKTEVLPEDHVLAVTLVELEDEVRDVLLGKALRSTPPTGRSTLSVEPES